MKNSTVKDMMSAIRDSSPKTSGYDTVAEVRRIEDGTAWVHIPGGVDETPVALTIDAKAGDQVQVRVGGGSAWLVGNASAPPTDDYTANIARGEASAANQRASTAMESAEEARAAADDAIASAATAAAAASAAQTSANEAKTSATNASEYASRALGNLSTVQSVAETLTWITQHGTMTLTSDTEPDPTHVYFVRDANGDYEVGNYKYSIVSEPDADDMSTYYELSIDESLNNYVGTHLAVTAEGLWVLPASVNSYKVLIATGQGNLYAAAGIYMIDDTGDTVAYFDYHSLQMRDKEGNVYFHASDLRNTNGVANIREVYVVYNSGSDYIPLMMNAASTDYSVKCNGVEEEHCTKGISGVSLDYMAEIGDVYEINYTTRSEKAKAYTLGTRDSQSAIGTLSYAEGEDVVASGYVSHAEGQGSAANAAFSHAQNYYTIASSEQQTAIGRANIEDIMYKYALIIGNGVPAARSNALTVDWNGDVALDISKSDTDSIALNAAITALGWQNEVIV